MQQRLVEDLLDLSRIVVGTLPLNHQPVDVARVAQLALDTVRPVADLKGVQLISNLQSDAGTVSGDAERLQQVVWNLLSNAVKFTPAAGRVSLAVQRVDGSHVRIAVSDTGVGISSTFLPRIFERFAQEDASTTRAHGGLGLGLSIVRSLVEMHGGTVTVSSDGRDRGSRFEVTLPTLAETVVEEPALAASATT